MLSVALPIICVAVSYLILANRILRRRGKTDGPVAGGDLAANAGAEDRHLASHS